MRAGWEAPCRFVRRSFRAERVAASRCRRSVTHPALGFRLPLRPLLPPFSPELGCSEIFRMCFSLVSWLGNLSCLGISPRVGLAVWGRLGGRGRAGWGEVRSVQPLVLRRVARGWGAALLCKFVTNLWRNDWNGGGTGWPRSLVAFCREKMKYRARCSGASSRKGKKNCFKWPFRGWMWLL